MTQEELQKALEAIGKGGITVNGDLVLSKHVEHEVGNVEAGGIGIQYVYGKNEDTVAVNKSQTNMWQGRNHIPDKLTTNESELLLNKLNKHNMLDEHWQPIGLSNAEKGVLAQRLSAILNIENQWQVFGALWGMNPETLRSAYNKAMEQKKTRKFLEKLNKLLN